MLIENRYFIPDGLYEAVGAIADKKRKTQHVAMMYRDDMWPSVGPEKLGLMWADLKTGKDCTWVFGPSRDELVLLRPAVILWIPPAWIRVETEQERRIVWSGTMSAYTPGPWTPIPQNNGSVIIAHEYETGQQMKPKGLRLVCHAFAWGNSLKEDEANACLISAAPELLEALKAIFEDNCFYHKDGDERAYQLATEAMAKAEGKS